MKVLVQYNDNNNSNLHSTIDIVIRLGSIRPTTVFDVTKEFVKKYNRNFNGYCCLNINSVHLAIHDETSSHGDEYTPLPSDLYMSEYITDNDSTTKAWFYVRHGKPMSKVETLVKFHSNLKSSIKDELNQTTHHVSNRSKDTYPNVNHTTQNSESSSAPKDDPQNTEPISECKDSPQTSTPVERMQKFVQYDEQRDAARFHEWYDRKIGNRRQQKNQKRDVIGREIGDDADRENEYQHRTSRRDWLRRPIFKKEKNKRNTYSKDDDDDSQALSAFREWLIKTSEKRKMRKDGQNIVIDDDEDSQMSSIFHEWLTRRTERKHSDDTNSTAFRDLHKITTKKIGKKQQNRNNTDKVDTTKSTFEAMKGTYSIEMDKENVQSTQTIESKLDLPAYTIDKCDEDRDTISLEMETRDDAVADTRSSGLESVQLEMKTAGNEEENDRRDDDIKMVEDSQGDDRTKDSNRNIRKNKKKEKISVRSSVTDSNTNRTQQQDEESKSRRLQNKMTTTANDFLSPIFNSKIWNDAKKSAMTLFGSNNSDNGSKRDLSSCSSYNHTSTADATTNEYQTHIPAVVSTSTMILENDNTTTISNLDSTHVPTSKRSSTDTRNAKQLLDNESKIPMTKMTSSFHLIDYDSQIDISHTSSSDNLSPAETMILENDYNRRKVRNDSVNASKRSTINKPDARQSLGGKPTKMINSFLSMGKHNFNKFYQQYYHSNDNKNNNKAADNDNDDATWVESVSDNNAEANLQMHFVTDNQKQNQLTRQVITIQDSTEKFRARSPSIEVSFSNATVDSRFTMKDLRRIKKHLLNTGVSIDDEIFENVITKMKIDKLDCLYQSIHNNNNDATVNAASTMESRTTTATTTAAATEANISQQYTDLDSRDSPDCLKATSTDQFEDRYTPILLSHRSISQPKIYHDETADDTADDTIQRYRGRCSRDSFQSFDDKPSIIDDFSFFSEEYSVNNPYAHLSGNNSLLDNNNKNNSNSNTINNFDSDVAYDDDEYNSEYNNNTIIDNSYNNIISYNTNNYNQQEKDKRDKFLEKLKQYITDYTANNNNNNNNNDNSINTSADEIVTTSTRTKRNNQNETLSPLGCSWINLW